jgi:hypothetical protein
MNINELFEKLQEETFLEDLNGEFILEGNCIIWSYNLENDAEEVEAPIEDPEGELIFEATSPEELLHEAYSEDLEAIEELIAELEDYTEWTFSEPELGELSISFKIF